MNVAPARAAKIVEADPPENVSGALADGGFGVVYRHPDRPLEVIKRFKEPESLRGSVLVDLMRIEEWARPSDRAILTDRFAWPTQVYRRDRHMTGFSMRAVPPEGQFELTTAGSTKTQLLQLKYFVDPTFWAGAAVQSARPELSNTDRIEVSIRLLETIEALHRCGLVYRDFSSNNICVLPGARPSVMILDVDSIRRSDDVDASPIQSPGWTAPDADPVGRDTSLAALAVWRILVDHQHATPGDDGESMNLIEDADLRSRLESIYRSPNAGDLEGVTRALRRLREDQMSSALFTEAVTTGFARHVLAEQLGAATAADRRTVELAELQVELEAEIESASASTRRRLERRLVIRGAGLVPDLLPADGGEQRLTDRDALRRAALDARFAEVTESFLRGDVASEDPELELDSFLRRSIQHVLAETGDMEFTAVAGDDSISLDWTWPDNSVVSAAAVTLEQPGGGRGETIVRRDPGESRGFIDVGGLAGKDIRVRCRPAAVSPGGTVIPAATGRTAAFTLPRPQVVAAPGWQLPASDRPQFQMDGSQLVPRVPDPPIRHWSRRPRWIAALIVLVLVVALGAVAAVNVLGGNEQLAPGPCYSTPGCMPVVAANRNWVAGSLSHPFRIDQRVSSNHSLTTTG